MEQKNFNLKSKDLIFALIYLLLFALCLYLLYLKQPNNINNKLNEISTELKTLDSLKVNLNTLNTKQKEIDTIINTKINNYIYENKIFMDSLIISNDSVDKFIANYLKQRQSQIPLLY